MELMGADEASELQAADSERLESNGGHGRDRGPSSLSPYSVWQAKQGRNCNRSLSGSNCAFLLD